MQKTRAPGVPIGPQKPTVAAKLNAMSLLDASHHASRDKVNGLIFAQEAQRTDPNKPNGVSLTQAQDVDLACAPSHAPDATLPREVSMDC